MIMTDSRVMPSRMPSETGGVDITPSRTMKMFSPCLGDVAGLVEHDCLDVAVLVGLDASERAVEVVCRGLDRRRRGVDRAADATNSRRRPRPRAARPRHVGAPRPARDNDVDRSGQRIDAHDAVARIASGRM